jgi:hypothetical protein
VGFEAAKTVHADLGLSDSYHRSAALAMRKVVNLFFYFYVQEFRITNIFEPSLTKAVNSLAKSVRPARMKRGHSSFLLPDEQNRVSTWLNCLTAWVP